MPSSGSTPDARLLAPLALGLFAVAVILTVVLSLGSGEDSKPSGSAPPPPVTPSQARPRPPAPARRSTYTVRRNDTLAAIADKTGVPLERLQELNPGLDPQGLVSGQRIKLR